MPETPLIENLVTDRQGVYIRKLYSLTPRELEVIRLIFAGLKNEEIARQLNIRPGTVKTHIRNIYRRMGLHGGKIQILLRVLKDLEQMSKS